MSKTKRKAISFNADDDDDVDIRHEHDFLTTPVKIRKIQSNSNMKVRGKKYDFNDCEQEEVRNDKGPILEINTIDSMHNDGIFKENVFNRKPTNQKDGKLTYGQMNKKRNQGTIDENNAGNVIFTEKQNKKSLQKQGQNLETSTEQPQLTYPANIILHIQQINYIENLASIIFTTLFSDLDETIFLNEKLLKKEGQISFNNDYHIRKQSQIFISLLQILNTKKQKQNGENIRQPLKQWTIQTLKTLTKKQPILPTNPPNSKDTKLLMFAQYRLQQLAMQSLNKGQIDDALCIANIDDKAMNRKLDSKNKDLKYCYNRIEGQKISNLPKICWLIDLGLAICYFRGMNLDDIIRQITKKYQDTKNIQLPSSFYAIISAFQPSKKISLMVNDKYEGLIDNLINVQSRQKYLHQLFIFYLFKKQQNIYQNTIQTLQKALIHKFFNSKIFIEFIVYLNITTKQQYLKILDCYINRNNYNNSKQVQGNQNKNVRLEKLLEDIQNYNQDEMQSSQIIQLRKWRNYKLFQSKTLKKHHYLALNDYLLNSNEIQTSLIVDHNQIQQYLLDNCTSFQFLCTFRQLEKKKHLQLLYKLSIILINNQKADKIVDKIQGCICFLEMKLNIFNLIKNNTIQSLWSLYRHIQSSTKVNQIQNKIKNHIKRVLSSHFQTNDGRIYLKNEINETFSNKVLKQRFLTLISRRQNYESQDQSLKNNKMSKIIDMIGQDSQSYKFIMINLIFQ